MIYNTSGRQMYNKNDKLEYRYRVKKKRYNRFESKSRKGNIRIYN